MQSANQSARYVSIEFSIDGAVHSRNESLSSLCIKSIASKKLNSRNEIKQNSVDSIRKKEILTK